MLKRLLDVSYNRASRLPRGSWSWKTARALYRVGASLFGHGQEHGRTASPDLREALSPFLKAPRQVSLPLDAVIDIVIPVYNGHDHLMRLWVSLAAGTQHPYRLILVDDASSDEKTRNLLHDIVRERPDTVLIRHDRNEGFIRSVNEGATFARGHFVVLNTDVEVPSDWMERLLEPIFADPSVASATPITNAGTICSFPRFLEDNTLPAGVSVNAVDAVFRHVNPASLAVDIPTAVGFCMGFNKSVVDQIGMFDAETYGRGYAEENDWCMRAQRKGYRNVVVPNLFVLHHHGGTFSPEEKRSLLERNLRQLEERFPEYPRLISRYVQLDPLKEVRNIVQLLLFAKHKATKRTLVFDHGLGGGAHLYRQRTMRAGVVRNELFLHVAYDAGKKNYRLQCVHRDQQVEFWFEDFDSSLCGLLDFISIDEILVNNIVSYPEPPRFLGVCQNIQRQTGCRITFCLHDYFCICPSYNLLNDSGKYCGVPSLDECIRCIATNRGEFRVYYPEAPEMPEWREKWGEFLQLTDRIVCFSNVSREILLRAYGTIPSQKIQLKPHTIDDLPVLQELPRHRDDCVIGILGRISEEKGLGVVKEMLRSIHSLKNQTVKIVVIGTTSEHLRDAHLHVTGAYQRTDLPELIRAHGVQIVFVPSIWPETFSFTAEEAATMGLPLAVFNIGAPAERIRTSGRGIIIDRIDGEFALHAILKYCDSQRSQVR